MVFISFDSNGKDELQQKLYGVLAIAPYLLPGSDGYKMFSVNHKDELEYALVLKFQGDGQGIQLCRMCAGRSEGGTRHFSDFGEALMYIQAHCSDTAFVDSVDGKSIESK